MDLLDKLNFTKYEKEILKVLLKYNLGLNAIQISKYSKVPSNKVYQVINKLVLENIILKTNTTPKKYSLQNFDRFLEIKIREKKGELHSLEKDYDKFLEEYKEPKVSDDFWILNDLDSLLKKIEISYRNLEFSSCAFIETWLARYSTLKMTKFAIDKGKIVKFIGTINSENKEIVKKWLKIGAEIKHIDFNNKAGFSVFDNTKVKISIQGDKLRSIWSENESLALILQNYFDMLWEKGEKITLKNIDEFCKNK